MSENEGILTRTLNEQGHTEPGVPGYWKVWGAGAVDIQVGDMLRTVIIEGDGPDRHPIAYPEHEVAEKVPSWGRMGLIRRRFRNTEGELFSIGTLQPIELFRKGTHNMLSEHVR